MHGSSVHKGRKGRFVPVSEVNVTPLVDIMLVLLIIFMITAPMMTVGVKVDLPQTNAPSLADQTEPLMITIKKDESVYIQETAVSVESLVALLQAITMNKKDTKIYLRADKTIPYGKAMEIMGLLAAAQFTKVALVADQKN